MDFLLKFGFLGKIWIFDENLNVSENLDFGKTNPVFSKISNFDHNLAKFGFGFDNKIYFVYDKNRFYSKIPSLKIGYLKKISENFD